MYKRQSSYGSRGHSSYGGSSSFGSGSRGGSGSSYGGARGFGSSSRHGGSGRQGSGQQYGSGSRFGSSTGLSRGGKVTTRRTAPKSSLSSARPASSLSKDNNLNIADFHAGDKVTHDQYGLGTVVDTQDKGRNSVITVDFGSSGVKRLMLRVAPLEKL